MRCASALGLVLLLSAHGQVWPWLVSERLDTRCGSTSGAAGDSAGRKQESPRRRPLAVLATLPDPSPLRNVVAAYSATAERSASADRGNHAAGSRDGAPAASACGAFDAEIASTFPCWEPVTIVVAPLTSAPPVRTLALGNAILTHAPPA